MSTDNTYADVLLAFLEYRAIFREPVFEAWDRRGNLAITLFRAFQQWNVALENIYAAKQNPSNASEIQMNVDLFDKRMTFTVGLGAASLFVNSPAWSEADVISQVAQAGVTAVKESTRAEIDKQQITLAMHLRAVERSQLDIVSKFVVLELAPTQSDKIRGYGMALYRDDGSWLVETSGLYADSLFIRLQRSFSGQLPFDDLAQQFREDENNLLQTLALRLD